MIAKLDNIDKPPYPIGSRVRVWWTFAGEPLPGGFTGKIAQAPRWTAVGWEACVLRDDLPEQPAKWVQADHVAALSAVELLAELAL